MKYYLWFQNCISDGTHIPTIFLIAINLFHIGLGGKANDIECRSCLLIAHVFHVDIYWTGEFRR